MLTSKKQSIRLDIAISRAYLIIFHRTTCYIWLFLVLVIVMDLR